MDHMCCHGSIFWVISAHEDVSLFLDVKIKPNKSLHPTESSCAAKK